VVILGRTALTGRKRSERIQDFMTIWQRISDMAVVVAEGGKGLLSTLGRGAHVPATEDLRRAETSVAFTMAVIALSAKMAKADGVVLGIEKDAFYRAFRIADAEADNVDRVFRLAQQDTAGFELYAEQIARALDQDQRLLIDVLDCLFHIATADRAMHPGEDMFLAEVARRFGLTNATFRHRRAQFVVDPSSPYDVLGLDPAVSNEDLKTRHRKLVRENHPDLLIGRGLPAEAVQVATRRLAAINDAYRVIARERGL
jgi:DnaJ like chaperone protein